MVELTVAVRRSDFEVNFHPSYASWQLQRTKIDRSARFGGCRFIADIHTAAQNGGLAEFLRYSTRLCLSKCSAPAAKRLPRRMNWPAKRSNARPASSR